MSEKEMKKGSKERRKRERMDGGRARKEGTEGRKKEGRKRRKGVREGGKKMTSLNFLCHKMVVAMPGNITAEYPTSTTVSMRMCKED